MRRRHERFVRNRSKGLNLTQAHIQAGYKSADAHIANRGALRLMARPDVRARLAELESRAASKAVLTRKWGLERLMSNVERAMQAEEVVIDGKRTGLFKYDGHVA